MPAPTITTPPTAPNRSLPATFSVRMDDFLAWIVSFKTELDTLIAYINTIFSGSDNGIGYVTGAGGAVTQTGSRATGVTLNKPTGTITLVSAAGSTAWDSFVLTNSTLVAGDVVVVSQKTGTNYYQFATRVIAGSCRIGVSAYSGTATEAPQISFAVIKAVNA